ncbi:MAG: sulfite exporter TauE/SafE family protein [Actinomycetota bacterium]|nr:sulfite exporter TauE/SafE family protein [Actinomycetota bacterium]
MTAWPWIALAGGGVGLLVGLFGVGGSSVATPVLGLLGVPGLAAVASPIPATIPAALSGAHAYVRSGDVHAATVRRSLLGAVPATVVGALLSRAVGGHALLIASGVVLAVVGLRVVRPVPEADRRAGAGRRQRPVLVVAAAAGVGLFTGLLANGGGFLLVPLYLLVLGLPMRPAAGTSLVVITVLSVPTLITHWALGNIDWVVAAAFAAGAVPGAVAGSRLAGRLVEQALQRAFGWLLIVFATFFTVQQVLTG